MSSIGQTVSAIGQKNAWTMARALGGFCEMRIGAPDTNKRATATIWPWLSGKSPQNILCSPRATASARLTTCITLFARKRTWTIARALGGFCEMRIGAPGTHKRATATFWPWLSGKSPPKKLSKSPQNIYFFAQKRTWTIARALGGFCKMRIYARDVFLEAAPSY